MYEGCPYYRRKGNPECLDPQKSDRRKKGGHYHFSDIFISLYSFFFSHFLLAFPYFVSLNGWSFQAIFFCPGLMIRPDLSSTGRRALYMALTRTVEITAFTKVAAVLHFASTSAIC